MSRGNLDFAIHIEQAQYGDEYRVEQVASNPSAILTRASHPLASGEVSWEQLLNYPVIRLYISDLDQIEIFRSSEAFQRVRSPNQGSLETSHLATALEVLRTTDYFMPGPAYILQNTSVSNGIIALSIPPGDEYTLDYMLVSHHRTDGSPLHQWFRAQIKDTLADLQAHAANPQN